MSVTTVDGQTFSFGDFEEHVCMQSVAKPITYCMAAEEHGLDHVHRCDASSAFALLRPMVG